MYKPTFAVYVKTQVLDAEHLMLSPNLEFVKQHIFFCSCASSVTCEKVIIRGKGWHTLAQANNRKGGVTTWGGAPWGAEWGMDKKSRHCHSCVHKNYPLCLCITSSVQAKVQNLNSLEFTKADPQQGLWGDLNARMQSIASSRGVLKFGLTSQFEVKVYDKMPA